MHCTTVYALAMENLQVWGMAPPTSPLSFASVFSGTIYGSECWVPKRTDKRKIL